MVGGDPGAIERCRPVFETFGDPVVHLGPLGAGQVTKLLNNTLSPRTSRSPRACCSSAPTWTSTRHG